MTRSNEVQYVTYNNKWRYIGAEKKNDVNTISNAKITCKRLKVLKGLPVLQSFWVNRLKLIEAKYNES